MKSMKKLQKTNTLNIVQMINYLIILGIFGFGGIIALFLFLIWRFLEMHYPYNSHFCYVNFHHVMAHKGVRSI